MAALSDPDAERLLRAAGWTPGRNVDAAQQIDALVSEGYDVGESVAALIANLAGLTIEFIRGGRADTIRFDPSRAASCFFKEWVDDYSGRVRAALTPMGLSDHEHLLLLVAEDGRWFGGFDDVFGFLGRSTIEVVDVLSNNRGFQND